MKSNRRVALGPDFFTQHPISKAKPGADSLFWEMWHFSEDIAQKALATPFIQGIGQGTLDPVVYGGYNVSDAYYCFRGAEDYKGAAQRETDPILKAFLEKKHESYAKYNATFPRIWHVKDATGIVPSEVCHQYADFESSVAGQEAGIYTLIAMLPCEYLWAWLAAQLAPAQKGNLYAPWITGNNDPSGAYAMGNLIEKYRDQIDTDKANQIYHQATVYEWQNFLTATENQS